MTDTNPTHWLHVVLPFVVYGLSVLALAVAGSHDAGDDPFTAFLRRISRSLQRLTGYPGWVMAGVLSGLLMLWVGMIGVYWDVAFHIDRGRDEVLFTPSHTMIVLALSGLVYSAGVAVVYATLERVPTRLRLGALRVPWSALALGALGAGGLAGFPLDELWHRAFGIDVTLWSPTHLILVAGGGMSPIALWLMLAEGRADASPTVLGRMVSFIVAGAVLTGLTAFQGEFDFGVPQFQVLYLPLLVAAAGGFALVASRLALGPGGAVGAVVAYLVLRGCVALLVGGVLGHTVPRFPLYLAGAVTVEAVAWWLGTERRLRFAVVAGAAMGSVGLAGELPWVAALDWFHVSASVLPKAAALAPLAGVAAAVVAAGLGRVVPGGSRVGAGAVAVALATLLVVLAYPLPREVGQVEALIRLRPVGSLAEVEVEVQPPDAVDGATAFGVVAWQGGGRVVAELREMGPGRYVTAEPVPVSGTWKTMVGLQRGPEVMAAPIYLPPDPEIGAEAFPALAERRVAFVRNTDVLLREAHGGPGWAAVAGYGGLAVAVAAWFGLLGLCAVRISRDRDAGPGPNRPVTEPAGACVGASQVA
ncbi:MAG: hypothetical protein M3N25_03975 [Actinomycetota bacterium]|nr:hypothetical protein [Actinomycetota bacterium]